MSGYVGIAENNVITGINIPNDELTDSELIDLIGALYSQANDINRQVEDDLTEGNRRGPEWVGKAKHARRIYLKRVDELRVEAASRGFDEPVPEIAEKAAQGRAIHEAQMKSMAQKASHLASDGSHAELFLAAARKCLSPDDRQRIWDRAREMFPNNVLVKQDLK